MKKSGLIVALAVLILISSVIISVSLVSASWFGDVWNKIIGRTIEENITTEPAPVLAPEPGTEENITCEDSDGGLDYNVQGYVSKGEQTQYDVCKEQTGANLVEGFCDGNELKEGYYLCPNGCSDGACLSGECPTIIGWRIENNRCVSDSGCNYDSSRYNYYGTEEKCVSQLREFIHETEPQPKPEPPEPASVEETKICATKIIINFNKEIYYYGDSIKVVIEIFDSQGNRIPNYAFYSQIYTYHDNMWHTLSGDKTDESGYKIFEGIVEESKMALGKAKQKVYTKAYANCGSVEDIVEVEIRKGEKEEVCGIGVCVPEEKAKVEEIPKEKMLYSCSGCELEDKCHPIGYRKEGKYCGINNEFIVQLEKGSCENSFECKSNVCISDECISESLMKKIINWFKKLFGKEEPEPELEAEPEAEKCSELLIEKNIGDYNYKQSAYGYSKESQAPLYSEDGKQIGTIKCCVADYIGNEGKKVSALVCPFDSREAIENSLKWLSARGEISLGEYKGQEVYNIGNVKTWTHEELIIAVGTDPKASEVPEEIAEAYLDKFPNDLKGVPAPGRVEPEKEFLDKIKGLGEVTLINFETLPDGTILQNGDKLTGNEWESLGVTFETPSEEYLKVFGPMYPFNPLDKLSLSPGFGPFESGSDTHDDLNIIFSEPVKAAGIYLLDLGGTDERESITFLDENNNVLEKISPWPKSTFGNPAPGTFVGLVHDGISKIEILENTQDGDDIAYDNLYFVK